MKMKARLKSKDSKAGSSIIEQVERDQNFQHASLRSVSIIIGLLVLGLVFSIPLKNLFRELANVAALENEKKQVIALKNYEDGELQRWQDNKFIVSYARDHYALINPGETAIHITDPESAGHDKDIEKQLQQVDKTAPETSAELQDAIDKYRTPWYLKIYNSIQNIEENNTIKSASGGSSASSMTASPQPTSSGVAQ